MRSNVTPEEIAHFNHLKSEWWDPEGQLKTLHHINPARLEFIQNHVSIAGKQILDIGCGGGILVEGLAKAGGFVTGLDLAEDLLNVASEHARHENVSVTYECKSIEDFSLEQPESFDVITCMEMLEHVPDPKSIIKAAVLCLKPGGWLFLSTLNRNMKSYLFSVIAAEYLLHLLPMHTHQYSKFIKPSEMVAWIRANGVEVKTLSGIHYNPLTQRATLARDTSVNYLLAAWKPG